MRIRIASLLLAFTFSAGCGRGQKLQANLEGPAVFPPPVPTVDNTERTTPSPTPTPGSQSTSTPTPAPTSTPSPTATPVPRIIPVGVNNQSGNDNGAKAYDGDETTFWSSGTVPEFDALYLKLDLGDNYDVRKIRVKTGAASALILSYYFHTATNCNDAGTKVDSPLLTDVVEGQWIEINVNKFSVRCVSVDRKTANPNNPGPSPIKYYEIEIYP